MDERGRRFEQVVVPHLGAAFNLARWLTRDDHDARDIVQDAALRALRFLDGLRGEDARPWLLGIVRNTTWSWLQANRHHATLYATGLSTSTATSSSTWWMEQRR